MHVDHLGGCIYASFKVNSSEKKKPKTVSDTLIHDSKRCSKKNREIHTHHSLHTHHLPLSFALQGTANAPCPNLPWFDLSQRRRIDINETKRRRFRRFEATLGDTDWTLWARKVPGGSVEPEPVAWRKAVENERNEAVAWRKAVENERNEAHNGYNVYKL